MPKYATVAIDSSGELARLYFSKDMGKHFTAHEDIEKIYAKGGMVASKGQAPPDPVAVKGWPDIPGKRAPDEFCRACDNVLRVRRVNNKPACIAQRESIGTGADYWEVKDRFNGPAIQSGLLPASYS